MPAVPSSAAAMPCKEAPALITNDPDLARRAEEAGLNALPAPRQVLLDGWLLRFADGCTRRANSVNPLWPGSAIDTDDRIRRCGALYAAQSLPCLFRIPSFQPPGLDAALDAHGYAPPEGDTRILFRPSLDGADGTGVELTEGQPGPEWLDAQARIAGGTTRMADARRAMLAGLAIPAVFGAVRLGGPGAPLASLAYAAVHDRLACVNMVVTDPAARRRGLSRRVLLRLLAWARGVSAEGTCLQVAADNAAAIPLYEDLASGRSCIATITGGSTRLDKAMPLHARHNGCLPGATVVSGPHALDGNKPGGTCTGQRVGDSGSVSRQGRR